jgi:hypothetical protein
VNPKPTLPGDLSGSSAQEHAANQKIPTSPQSSTISHMSIGARNERAIFRAHWAQDDCRLAGVVGTPERIEPWFNALGSPVNDSRIRAKTSNQN